MLCRKFELIPIKIKFFMNFKVFLYINTIIFFIFAGIVHGDYRPENVVFHPTEVRTND